MAILLRNFWLLFGVIISFLAMFTANPFNPSKNFFSKVAWVTSLIFVVALIRGDQTATILSATYAIPYWAIHLIYYHNQDKLKEVALKNEIFLIYLYQIGKLGFRDNTSDKTYWHLEDTIKSYKQNEGQDLAEDEVYEKAKAFILTRNNITAMEIKEHFNVGYAHAAKIINDLESGGYINPVNYQEGRTINKKEEDILRARAKYLENKLPSRDEESDAVLLEEAKELVKSYKKISASQIQKRLKIGYARAARILDELEDEGYVGVGEGAKPRQVLK